MKFYRTGHKLAKRMIHTVCIGSVTHYELTAVITEDSTSLSINFSGCCSGYKTTFKSTTDSSIFIVTADNIFTDYQ